MKLADLYLAILIAAIVTSALGAVLFVPISPLTLEVDHDSNPDSSRRP